MTKWEEKLCPKTNYLPSSQALLKQLEIDGPSAVKLAVEELELEKETETVELSLLLCDDGYMQKLNKEWLGKDSPTDVLSFPQDQAPGMTPIVRPQIVIPRSKLTFSAK